MPVRSLPSHVVSPLPPGTRYRAVRVALPILFLDALGRKSLGKHNARNIGCAEAVPEITFAGSPNFTRIGGFLPPEVATASPAFASFATLAANSGCEASGFCPHFPFCHAHASRLPAAAARATGSAHKPLGDGTLHEIVKPLLPAFRSWHQAKLFIEHSLRIEHGTIHVIAGVLVWLALAIVSRRPVTARLPWLGLFALILWNEAVDLWVEKWPDPGMQYGEGAKDIFLTMLVPTIIMLAVNFRPQLFRPQIPRRRTR